MAKESGVEPVPTLPPKPQEFETARSITDVDVRAMPAEITYAAFMAEAKQRGKMTHAEAANAWNVHKANMAAEAAQAAEAA